MKSEFVIGFLVLIIILVSVLFQNCSSHLQSQIEFESIDDQDPVSEPEVHAYDLFLVIGQSNAVGINPADQSVSIQTPLEYAFDFDADLQRFKPLDNPTGIPNSRCGTPCYWTARNHSFIPSFAFNWRRLTGHSSMFVPRASSGRGAI